MGAQAINIPSDSRNDLKKTKQNRGESNPPRERGRARKEVKK